MEVQAIDGATEETLAIVFGDLVGLDKLTTQLGDLQTNLLRQQFFERTHKLIQNHEGELVKTVGDGFLAVFPQVANAVEFGIATLQLGKDERSTQRFLQLWCRAGIHFASVTVKRTDGSLEILGPELKYAARLLGDGQAKPITLSEAAERNLPLALSEQLRLITTVLSKGDSDRSHLIKQKFTEAIKLMQDIQAPDPAAHPLRTDQETATKVRLLAHDIAELRANKKLEKAIALLDSQDAKTLQNPRLGELQEALRKELARNEALTEAISRSQQALQHAEWTTAREPLDDIRRVFGEFEALTRATSDFETVRVKEADRLTNQSVALAKTAILAGDWNGARRELEASISIAAFASTTALQERERLFKIFKKLEVKKLEIDRVAVSPSARPNGISALIHLFHSLTASLRRASDSPQSLSLRPSQTASTSLKTKPVLQRSATASRSIVTDYPAASAVPLPGGGFTQLIGAMRDAREVTPRSSSPDASPLAAVIEPASPTEFTRMFSASGPSKSTSQPSPHANALVMPTPNPRESKHPKSDRVRSSAPPFAAPMFSNSLPIECAPEAIVVIDIVQATATSDLFGWYAVGRVLIRELREYVREIGAKYDMCCIKSTGDGFLLTYRNEDSAEVAAIQAVRASHELLTQLAIRNLKSPEQRKIAVRLALHFGEVDILPDDRQGPNISYAFRVEAISRASLLDAINAIDPELFPLRDYIICSERVCEIVNRHLPDWNKTSCGLFKLKGFTGWGELFLIAEGTA